MRILFIAIWNLFVLIWFVLGLPLRLLAIRGRPAYVQFRLSGDPPYRGSMGRRRWKRRRGPLEAIRSVESFRRAVEVLLGDRRLRGIIVTIDSLHVPPAKRDALAEILSKARSAGKEVIGYAVACSTSEYELLSSASRILMAPAGRLELIGFATELSAIGRGLNALGVEAHFVRRGDYKTAPELFTRETASEIQLTTIDEFLEERYQNLLGIISHNRGLSLETATQLVDQGPYSAKRAVAVGLCDALVSEGDLETFLGSERKVGLGSFDHYTRGLIYPPLPWRPFRRRPRVTVVPLKGLIAYGDGGGIPGGPTIAGSEAMAAALRKVGKSRAKAVVLYVDSPGGSALASDLILEEVKRIAKDKPVIAYFDRVAASGGYLAALGAREIWAAPHAIAGSIGVFAGKFDLHNLFGRIGVSRAIVAKGENAALLSPSRPFTEHELSSLQDEIEETYQAFLQEVAQARKRSKEEIHARAEGRVYSGVRALKAGLVDGVGGFEQACRRALELAGIPSDNFELAVQAAPVRRIPILHLLRWASRVQVYALWPDGLTLGGLTDAAPLPRL